MNSWGKGVGVVLLLALVSVVSCEDEDNLLGFQSPDENFKVVYQEFNLPTSVYQVDSVVTSNGSGAPIRVMAGSYEHNTYGNADATAYLQYFPVIFPVISDTATFDRLTLTIVFDYYHFGSETSGDFTFEVHELVDSLVTSSAYYTKSSTLMQTNAIGTVSKVISPSTWDQAAKTNSDTDTKNDVADSLYFNPLSPALGQAIFEAMKASDSVSKAKYRNFFRWRRIFNGLAINSTAANMIIGLNPDHVKSRLTLHYKEGTSSTAARQVDLTISPSRGMMTYTGLTTDRSGTALAGLSGFYNDIDVPGGERFVQCGGGVVTKVDLTPVYDYFDDIPLKSLNVAELSIVTNAQEKAPSSFILRAVRADNRFLAATRNFINNVYDSVPDADPVFFSKHHLNIANRPRADILGDDGSPFSLSRRSDVQAVTSVYKGFMTNFLQRELNLVDKDYLREFTLLPISPDFSKSLNGFQFHKDSVRLRVYYTTPNLDE